MRVFRVRKLLELQSKLVNLLIWCSETCLSKWLNFFWQYKNLSTHTLWDSFPYPTLYALSYYILRLLMYLYTPSVLLVNILHFYKQSKRGFLEQRCLIQHAGVFSCFIKGRQPFLLHLLSLYKVFCPELVTLSIPSRMKVCTWTVHLLQIKFCCKAPNKWFVLCLVFL